MYKKILGPLDGSKLSECSLEHIKAISTGCNVSDVVLLAVVDSLKVAPPQFTEWGWGSREAAEAAGEEWQRAVKEQQQKAQDYLEKAASNLRETGIQVETTVLSSEISEGVADKILDYARNNGVDLIVMSTHGRSGVSRFAFGSVTDKVMRHANIPVLTVVPAGCR